MLVVVDTTKVRIFKQITTRDNLQGLFNSCCWYHKGTNFQANHNYWSILWLCTPVVVDTTKVRIFKQITTGSFGSTLSTGCCWYHKGTNFQANHNSIKRTYLTDVVVVDTTKVRIFKQITTICRTCTCKSRLLLIPQRYEFSSKSQPNQYLKVNHLSCCWYHKGTNFQANHNRRQHRCSIYRLLLIPQRYEFSSKSQLTCTISENRRRCCWYHKGTNFQANHNR